MTADRMAWFSSSSSSSASSNGINRFSSKKKNGAFVYIYIVVIILLSGLLGCFQVGMAVSISSRRRAVLWDVDGTLSDSYMLGFSSTNAVLQKVGHGTIDEAAYHQGTKLTTPRRLAWHVTGNPDDPIGIDLGQQFDDLYVKLVSTETAPFYPGIMEVLNSIQSENKGDVLLGALSNACGAYVKAVLEVNGVTDRFAIHFGADEVPAAKPSPDGLLMICEKLNVDPAFAVYVGDSPSDGQAATAAGMTSIGVTWGSHPESTVTPAFTRTVHTTEQLKAAIHDLLAGMDDNAAKLSSLSSSSSSST